METAEESTLATRAISAVSSLSQSFQPSWDARWLAIWAAPLPYSRSTVMIRNISNPGRARKLAPAMQTLPQPDLRFNRHARAQYVLLRLALIERDFQRNALHDLYEISCRIFRR